MISTIRKLWHLFTRRERALSALLLPLLVLAAALETVGIAALPAFVALLADPSRASHYPLVVQWRARVGAQTDERAVLFAAAALLIFFIFKNLYLAGLAYIQARFAQGRRIRLSSNLFEAYMKSPYSFHLQRNPAELMRNATQEAVRVVDFALSPALLLAREMLVMTAALVLLLLVDPLLSLLVFVALGTISGLFYRLIRQRLSAAGHREHHHTIQLIRTVNEALGGIKEAKVLAREPFFVKGFTEHATWAAGATRLREFMQSLPRIGLETFAVMAVLTVAALSVGMGRPLSATLPTLVLLAVVVVRMIPSFNQITLSLGLLRYGQRCVDAIYDEGELLAEISRPLPAPADTPQTGDRDFLVLRNISYRYANTSTDAVSEVNLRVARGQAVGLAGATGSGKTTLANVILGLLPPTQGELLIDGIPLHGGVAGWHGRIGYVPQDIYLSDDTIRRNIAFGREDHEIDEAAVNRALESAQLQEVIANLPAGLDTLVGDRGVRLSGGQRQRIGIARALYPNPEILILDEATSALDNETERYLLEEIERLRGERTLIIIAHRLTTLRKCDELFFLKRGRLIAHGHYGELIESCADFRQMALPDEWRSGFTPARSH